MFFKFPDINSQRQHCTQSDIMAGAFTHLIIVDTLCREKLDSIPNLKGSVRTALSNCTQYCKLGAVSLDCPYFVYNTGATGYGNVMHYLRTADFIRYGVENILTMNFTQTDTRACIAWIFGYAAHIVTDLTLHPLIGKKFGDYSTSSSNQKAHRICELHQDAYLYYKKTGLNIRDVNFLDFSTLLDCSVNQNMNHLNPKIVDLWSQILRKYDPLEVRKYLRLYLKSIQPSNWYASYLNIFQRFVTHGGEYFQHKGMAFPKTKDIDQKYMTNFPKSDGTMICIDDLIAIAMENVLKTWTQLVQVLDKEDIGLFKLANANLDTGLTDNTDEPVFLV